MRCSCGRNAARCPGAYADDTEHDDLVLARAERGAAGGHVESCTLKLARLISEIESIKACRAVAINARAKGGG